MDTEDLKIFESENIKTNGYLVHSKVSFLKSNELPAMSIQDNG